MIIAAKEERKNITATATLRRLRGAVVLRKDKRLGQSNLGRKRRRSQTNKRKGKKEGIDQNALLGQKRNEPFKKVGRHGGMPRSGGKS